MVVILSISVSGGGSLGCAKGGRTGRYGCLFIYGFILIVSVIVIYAIIYVIIAVCVIIMLMNCYLF